MLRQQQSQLFHGPCLDASSLPRLPRLNEFSGVVDELLHAFSPILQGSCSFKVIVQESCQQDGCIKVEQWVDGGGLSLIHI